MTQKTPKNSYNGTVVRILNTSKLNKMQNTVEERCKKKTKDKTTSKELFHLFLTISVINCFKQPHTLLEGKRWLKLEATCSIHFEQLVCSLRFLYIKIGPTCYRLDNRYM